MNIELILFILIIGIGATFCMDLWALFLNRVFAVPSLNYCLVGRWVVHVGNGRFAHQTIMQSDSKPFECYIGWLFHYGVGIVFAGVLVAILSPEWLEKPTLLPAVIFGLITVIFPFFIMQPLFGLGIAASSTPNPKETRLRSLMAHASFGVGLYIAALLLSLLYV